MVTPKCFDPGTTRKPSAIESEIVSMSENAPTVDSARRRRYPG